MVQLNLYSAWIGILLGFASGALIGLFFHRTDWMGGYSSPSRRMIRLGHISFFGLAIINFFYALSASTLGLFPATDIASVLFICGAVTMPTICFLTAWKPLFRHAFFIPVLSLIIATLTSLKGVVL